MSDINETIAKHKGWKHSPETMQQISFWKKGKIVEVNPPDYLNDPRLYMALFEEMECVAILKNINKYSVTVYAAEAIEVNILFRSPVESDTIGGAICLAYCRMNGLECEG